MLKLFHGNQYSQPQRKYNKQKLENKKGGNTEDSTVHVSKDWEIELVNKNVWRKLHIQKKKLINTQCANIINTVAEELVSSENIAI